MLWPNKYISYYFFVIGFVAFVFLAVAVHVSHSSSPTSFIRCHVEGGYVPIRATTIEFFNIDQEAYLRVTKHFWEKEKMSLDKTIKIPLAEYKGIWNWIEKENIWDIEDFTFPAEDVPTYTFQLKKGNKEKTITAMILSKVKGRKYYSFYSILKELQMKYLPELS